MIKNYDQWLTEREESGMGRDRERYEASESIRQAILSSASEEFLVEEDEDYVLWLVVSIWDGETEVCGSGRQNLEKGQGQQTSQSEQSEQIPRGPLATFTGRTLHR